MEHFKGLKNRSAGKADTGGVFGRWSFPVLVSLALVAVFVFAVPSLDFTNPTPADSLYISKNWTEINITLTEPNLDTFRFNWNGTNYTFYDPSLVLALNFNNNSAIGENSTKAVDISKYGNNGTLVGGAAWNSSGRYSAALQLDGVDDYAIVSDVDNLDFGVGGFSVEAWVFPEDTGGNQQAILNNLTFS